MAQLFDTQTTVLFISLYCSHIHRKCFARGSPEQWLSSFEEIMQLTVKDLLKAGMRTYNKEIRRQWSQANPGQIVLTVVRILLLCECAV